jgi:hypothetical protein
MNTEIKELRTQCEVLRTKIDALVSRLDAAEQLMVIERCAQLKGRGVPCHVKANRIYHDITGALLN